MQLTFLGATDTVTGSKYLLNIDSQRILIDCGLFQGLKELRLRNWNKLPIDPASLDAVILTHAHIDHSGYLPLLIKNGFTGPVYVTQGTKDLCCILLPDSGYLQEEEAHFANLHGFSKHKPALPLYTQADAEQALKQLVVVDFNQNFTLAKNSYFHFIPAGHIIGSAFIYINSKNTSLLFSGDIGRLHDPIMHAPAYVKNADYLIVESTYGDRLHSQEPVENKLKTIINQTIARGGSVLIPAFAVGRVQSLLYYIYQLKQRREIEDVPIFLDSPLATNATEIFCRHPAEHRLSRQVCAAMCQINYIHTPDESKKLDNSLTPSIIISASGMASGGRVLHHLKIIAPDSRNTILFSGYQAAGTRGARIMQGEKAIKIHGEMIPVNAEIELLSNLSAHADYNEILEWLSHFQQAPRKVFITHGEPTAAAALQEKIKSKFGWNCVRPTYLQREEFNT